MNNTTHPITEYRRAIGLTLEEVGRMFNPPAHKTTVLRWEKGRVSPKRAVEIERVLGIKRERLLPEIFGNV